VLAAGAKPQNTEPEQDTSMNTSVQAEEGEENAENSLAAQTEMLNTVTQLLQQTSQVRRDVKHRDPTTTTDFSGKTRC
jgi:hypothetical protein